MQELTTIQISRTTVKRLKAFKLVGKESYEELLNRLLDKIIGKENKE